MKSYRDAMHITGRETANVAMHVACSIALAFHGSRPTVEKLRSHFGMSRATAYRWFRAWNDANGRCASGP